MNKKGRGSAIAVVLAKHARNNGQWITDEWEPAEEQRPAPKMTAPHRSLPLGTRARVTNLENGRSVTVTINDRGPHRRGRIIDLSRAAAQRLDMIPHGVVPVALQVVATP